MTNIQSYKDLKIWQRSMNVVLSVYELSNSLPSDEKFGLISQIRRSSVSIPSNIAEGYGRNSRKSFINFLRIAIGSINELETQLELVERLFSFEKIIFNQVNGELTEIKKMIYSFINSITESKNVQSNNLITNH